MSTQKPEETPHDLPATVGTHFAWIRTRMSTERTLEAWVRTAVSLIGFGFTIAKFFDHLNLMPHTRAPLDPNMPRQLGLALIAIGTCALGIAIWQYQAVLKYLNSPQFNNIARIDKVPRVPALLFVAVSLGIIGAIAFIAILFRSI